MANAVRTAIVPGWILSVRRTRQDCATPRLVSVHVVLVKNTPAVAGEFLPYYNLLAACACAAQTV